MRGIPTSRQSRGFGAREPTSPFTRSSVPRQPRSVRPEDSFGNGWFGAVPSCRFATFRVALAVTTLVFHVPKFNAFIRDYTASPFHVPPAFGWLPIRPPTGGGRRDAPPVGRARG